ncbi:MAG TPA: DHA2 family efflux MFS transporter permease subunit [Longimicrobiaceae bacterium]|nr:DHA2 family efflux MFS transporter permease subunit [Longimicrobiaceae bacterium]
MSHGGSCGGTDGLIRLASPAGRWTVAAAVLGSGAVFVESTVVSVALPAIARDFGLGMEGLQWLMNAYLLTLSALLLLGGSLGDVYGRRRVFSVGLVGFAATSLLCALAPSPLWLVAGRALQGAAGALLVPNSLAIVDAVFAEEDRGAAIGKWAGWSAVSTALGPLLGGLLVDVVSWRWVFAATVPICLAALVAARRVPEAPRPGPARSVDYGGAVLATAGLAGVVGALVTGPEAGFGRPEILAAGIGGAALLVAFFLAERRARAPLLPLSVFRSRQFAGANLTTLLVYAALGGVFFFVVLQLQNVLGYSALEVGGALLPINVLMLVLSPRSGRLSRRTGPRLPMTVGAALAAAGMLLLARVQPGAGYVGTVLPALVVLGVGLGMLVAPLTAAVLGAVDDEQTGVASAVNNAAARLANLLATAVLPLAAGLGGLDDLRGPAFAAGYARAMWICAGLCAAGAAVAWLTVRNAASVAPTAHPSPEHGCTHRRPLAEVEA